MEDVAFLSQLRADQGPPASTREGLNTAGATANLIGLVYIDMGAHIEFIILVLYSIVISLFDTHLNPFIYTFQNITRAHICVYPISCHLGGAVCLVCGGLPMRPGARICESFAKNGTCRVGTACRFDHPEGMKVGARWSPSERR